MYFISDRVWPCNGDREKTSLMLQLSDSISHTNWVQNTTALLDKKKFKPVFVSSLNLSLIKFSVRSVVHDNDIISKHLPILVLNRLYNYVFFKKNYLKLHLLLTRKLLNERNKITSNTSFLLWYFSLAVMVSKFLHIHLETQQLEAHAPFESSHQSFH